MDRILVSACLLGKVCRWDAKKLERDISESLNGFQVFGVCPEIEGGLPCPRPKAEIKGGGGEFVLDGTARVIDEEGCDVTISFLRGAQAALNLAMINDIKKAILKGKSPSCGVNFIYRNGSLVPGAGVAASLLKRHGIEVIPAQ